MAIGPRLDLRQSQSLVMTPQLRQAIKLLQFSNQEVAAFVEEELERNPLLERDERPDGPANERPALDQLPERIAVNGSAPDTAELVRGATVDLQVPAHSEIVIEFEVDLTTDVFEGPLGEYTGYYTPGSMKPLARVTAITHRTGAYCQALLTGIPPTENHIL